jgi:hypothetical protein
MRTASLGVACVEGARVGIIASQRLTSLAASRLAAVCDGAHAGVGVTRRAIGDLGLETGACLGLAGRGVTTVFRTGAGHRRLGVEHTLSLRLAADQRAVAKVTVVAGETILIALAATAVYASETLAPLALVQLGADIAVITRSIGWLVRTPLGAITHVLRTRLAIVAGHGLAEAVTGNATVGRGARVTVITGPGGHCSGTPRGRLAAIGGADIAVVAGDRLADTTSGDTTVGLGASVAVAARLCGRGVATGASVRVALVFGTDVAVVAAHSPCDADASDTPLVLGTSVAIITLSIVAAGPLCRLDGDCIRL